MAYDSLVGKRYHLHEAPKSKKKKHMKCIQFISESQTLVFQTEEEPSKQLSFMRPIFDCMVYDGLISDAKCRPRVIIQIQPADYSTKLVDAAQEQYPAHGQLNSTMEDTNQT